MDLTHDWKVLNEVLFPQDNIIASKNTMVVLEEQDQIQDGLVFDGTSFDRTFLGNADGFASCKSEAMQGIIHTSLQDLAKKYGVQSCVRLSNNKLRSCIQDVARLGPNYFQQIQKTRDLLLEKETLFHSTQHFVLNFLNSKIQKFMPRKFNFLIFVTESTTYKALLLSYANGKLDRFFEPDFSSLHEDRLLEWQKEYKVIGQYLESRYILPCYAIFISKEVWCSCCEASVTPYLKPWNVFVRAYNLGLAKVFPESVATRALLAIQRLMMYFARL